MSLHLPARRLVQASRSSTTAGPSPHLRYLLPQTQRRNAGWLSRINRFGFGKKKTTEEVMGEAIEKKKKEKKEPIDPSKLFKRMTNRTSGDSMFDEEIQLADQDNPGKAKRTGAMDASAFSRAREHTARALDPDPRWRVRWQRKKVMQMVRDNGRPLSKEQKLKLVEKECHSRSVSMPTSTKKLMFLARQIAGKTVDDAVTQMRYSKKKMGVELEYWLKEARDKAIVGRGMGLGQVNGEVFKEPRKIQTKDGKWITVQDPTALYVAQAWVGKSQYRGARVQYHSRGRQSLMWKPSAHIAFILKEEKTRLRLYDEKIEKQAKKKPWVHLPNRPVTAQRQFYSW